MRNGLSAGRSWNKRELRLSTYGMTVQNQQFITTIGMLQDLPVLRMVEK